LREAAVLIFRKGFMKYDIELALGGMINIPSFMKIGAGVVTWDTHTNVVS
jgi:hypothetical protein